MQFSGAENIDKSINLRINPIMNSFSKKRNTKLIERINPIIYLLKKKNDYVNANLQQQAQVESTNHICTHNFQAQRGDIQVLDDINKD